MTRRNVVVCLDGTGNQFKEDISNVVKLFRVIERTESQIAYYDPGVGTLGDPDYKTPIAKRINKAFGLGFGRGLTKNVEDAYAFLMNHLVEGDRLFIFGFSRGSYTARVLAGYIRSCGLLEHGNQSLIPYATKLYKAKNVDFKILQKFKSTYSRDVEIDFLGLWDSVSTFGWIYSPVFLPYTTNNQRVLAIRHALAIDERRSFFSPMHWGTKHAATQDIKEVWFAGVHSDVGGGYPESESGLAKIALDWMLQEASQPEFGLRLDTTKYDRYVLGKSGGGYVGPDHSGMIHNSLQGPWRLVQMLPRSVWIDAEDRQAVRKPTQHRAIPDGSTLHRSVLDRLASNGYAPRNLPFTDPDKLRDLYAIEQGRPHSLGNIHPDGHILRSKRGTVRPDDLGTDARNMPVPTGYFKVIFLPATGNEPAHAIGFLLPHTFENLNRLEDLVPGIPAEKVIWSFVSRIDVIEQASGVTFPGIPDTMKSDWGDPFFFDRDDSRDMRDASGGVGNPQGVLADSTVEARRAACRDFLTVNQTELVNWGDANEPVS